MESEKLNLRAEFTSDDEKVFKIIDCNTGEEIRSWRADECEALLESIVAGTQYEKALDNSFIVEIDDDEDSRLMMLIEEESGDVVETWMDDEVDSLLSDLIVNNDIE